MEEPNISVLQVRIAALENLVAQNDLHIRELIQIRFNDNQTAVAAAFAAAKELADTRHASSEKAIEKEQDKQSQYNTTHNDLNRKMEAQYSMMMPRTEATAQYQHILEKHEDLKKEIAGLRESRREGAGEKTGSLSNQRIIMMILSAIGSLLIIGGIVVSIAFAIRK